MTDETSSSVTLSKASNVLVIYFKDGCRDWVSAVDSFTIIYEEQKASILSFESLETLISFSHGLTASHPHLLLYYFEKLKPQKLCLRDLMLPCDLEVRSLNPSEIQCCKKGLSLTQRNMEFVGDDIPILPQALSKYKHLEVHGFDSEPSGIASHRFDSSISILKLCPSSSLLSLYYRLTAQVILPGNSLAHLSGDIRYTVQVGIKVGDSIVCICRNTLEKGSPCNCPYIDVCDNRATIQLDDEMAAKLESTHVHSVYENIANHFSHTRHKPWPKVMNFLDSLDPKGFLIDVGCGNGKYFGHHPGMLQIGCDHSFGLLQIVKGRGFEGVRCDALQLPFRSDVADAVISIAVIHHLSTWERRLSALKEMIRVLKVGGRLLIYSWAKEQNKDSSYLKKKRAEPASTEVKACDTQFPLVLPVHKNRTNFLHTDLLVPWKKKLKEEAPTNEGEEETFHRYYHMFQEGELEGLISSLEDAVLEEIYYEQGNWCAIAKKT